MKTARRSARKRLSPARVAAPLPQRNKLRAPASDHNGPPDKSETFAASASEWEARLCEMELRLTQSELENHKLREAYKQLEAHAASRDRLHDAAAVGFATLDTNGKILEINHTAAALLGWEKRLLLQRRFTLLVAPEDRKKFLEHFTHCQRGKRKAAPPPKSVAATAGQQFQIPAPDVEAHHAHSIEVRLRAAGGWPVIVQLACVPVRDERSRVVKLEITLIDITERKKTEDALLATERNLRALIEASPHPIQFKDAKARWQLANRAALELFDLTSTEYRNKGSVELSSHATFYREVLAARERKDRAVIRGGRWTRNDEIVPTPDGPDRVFDVIRVPLWQADGQPKGLVVLSYDITERKHAEEVIELESRFPRENPAPIMRLNQGRFLSYANPSAHELLEEWGVALGQHAPEDIVQTARDALTSEEKRDRELTCGSRVYAVAFAPIPRAGYVNLYFSEITERKRAEEKLRQSEDRFRTLASHAPVGIFLSDATGDSVYVNESWCAMTGLKPEEAWGRNWLKVVHPEDRERVAFGWEDAVSRRDMSDAEFRFQRSDGWVTWVQGKAIQLRDENGFFLGYIGTVADITERKRAERRSAANLAIARILADAPAVGDATPRILQAICETLGWDVGNLWMPDAEANVLRCGKLWHALTPQLEPFVSRSKEITLAPGVGLPGRVWESLQPVWIPDASADANFPRASTAAAAGLHTACAFPIMAGDKFLGVMEFFTPKLRERDERTLEMFGNIGSQIGQFMERKQAEEALRQAKEELGKVNAALEERVRVRTAELTHANEVLQAEIIERKRSELARYRLMGIVESSADAILTKTLRGTISSWNKAAERMFGYAEHEVVGRSIEAIIPQGREDELTQALASLRRGEGVESIDTVRRRKDGRLIEVSLTLSPITDETGTVRAASAIMRDITDRKQAERALRESEARLQAIMDNSPAMIFLKDTEGRYLHFNRQFARAFSLPLERGVGKTDAELFPPKQAAAFRANDLAVLEAGAAIVFDEVAVQDDGPHTSIVTKSPLFDGEGKIYAIVGIVTDITERKRLEEEVLHISEREHRRIAQDLHDGLGQQLAGISCLSNVLKRDLAAKRSPEAATATRISKLLEATVVQTRRLARGLHPVAPEPTGLLSALQELAASVTEMFKVSCGFECPQPVHIADNAMATHLYRIAQEAVTNSLKHGRAAKIKIGLSATPERIILAVGDDGVGFKKSAGRKKGLGLRIMSYRAGMIGGTLVMQKKAGGGTDIICTVEKTTALKPLNDDGQTTAKAKR